MFKIIIDLQKDKPKIKVKFIKEKREKIWEIISIIFFKFKIFSIGIEFSILIKNIFIK